MDTDTGLKIQENDTMKAIIEIELEMDGHYQKSDNQEIIDQILTSMDSAWVIENNRLIVIADSITCELKGKP
jgi:hypothetical protein